MRKVGWGGNHTNDTNASGVHPGWGSDEGCSKNSVGWAKGFLPDDVYDQKRRRMITWSCCCLCRRKMEVKTELTALATKQFTIFQRSEICSVKPNDNLN